MADEAPITDAPSYDDLPIVFDRKRWLFVIIGLGWMPIGLLCAFLGAGNIVVQGLSLPGLMFVVMGSAFAFGGSLFVFARRTVIVDPKRRRIVKGFTWLGYKSAYGHRFEEFNSVGIGQQRTNNGLSVGMHYFVILEGMDPIWVPGGSGRLETVQETALQLGHVLGRPVNLEPRSVPFGPMI